MVDSNKKNNRYDILIVLLIASQIFGMYGNALQPVRVFIILLSPFMLIYFMRHKSIVNYYAYVFLTFVVWLAYAWLSLIWANKINEGLIEYTYLVINLCGVLSIIYLSSRSNNPFNSIIKGWSALLVISIPIAVMEILFDIHLDVSFIEAGNIIGGLGIKRRFASVTYGNYNNYNIIVIFCLPFILSYLFIYKMAIKSILIWTIALLGYLALIINSSRGGIVAIFIFTILLLLMKKRGHINSSALIYVLIASIISVVYYSNEIFYFIGYRMKNIGFNDPVRMRLIEDSLDLLFRSLLFGVGVGNFQSEMAIKNPFGLSSAHNFLIEVLVPYGIFIFSLFLGLFVKILIKIKHNNRLVNKFIVYATLLVFPLSTTISSGYFKSASIWLLIGSLMILSDKNYMGNEK